MSQYDNPYYGNAGAGGGGGFLAGGSPFGSASGSPGGAGRRSEASHSLRAITCKQILGATQAHTDAEWMVDDIEIGQVTIVGHVMAITRQATNCVYWIEDGTARIEARRWIDSSNEGDSEGDIMEGSYARVTGALKTFGSKRYVNATHIRPSLNPSENFFHLLECMTAQRIFEKGPPPGPGQTNNSEGGQAGTSAYTTQSKAAAANDQYAHLPPIRRSIINAITELSQGAEGVHVGAIARAVGGGDANVISDALDKLMDEGLVFTTIDDSHFNTAQ